MVKKKVYITKMNKMFNITLKKFIYNTMLFALSNLLQAHTRNDNY